VKCGNIRQTRRGVCNSVGKSALVPLFIADYSSTTLLLYSTWEARIADYSSTALLLYSAWEARIADYSSAALLLYSTWEARIADYRSTAVFYLGGSYC
jgi:hypothetical protein